MQRDAAGPVALPPLRLVEALQAGLTRDCILAGGWWPPPYLGSSEDLSARIVPDVLEIDQLIEAKPPCDCIVLTAQHLLVKVQELLSPDSVTKKPPRPETNLTSAAGARYQQVCEHLAALNVYVHLLAQTAYMPAYGNLWGLSGEWLEALGYPVGMSESFGILGTSATDEIGWGQEVVPALFYVVKQHCLLARCVLDYARIDQVRRDLQSRNEIDPDNALEALVPTAHAIQAILAVRSTCACIANAVQQVVEAMEAIRSLAPQPRTN
jgi:hypothetical protein